MARKRRETSPSSIKLKQPDRSGPTEQSLLQLAQERGLFDMAQQKQDANKRKPSSLATAAKDSESGLSPSVERILDTLLWTVSLSMLHFSLDVLVQSQYAVEISWWKVSQRAAQAFLGRSQLLSRGNARCHVSSKLTLPASKSSACSSTCYMPTLRTRPSSPASLPASNLPFDRRFSSSQAHAPGVILYTLATDMGIWQS